MRTFWEIAARLVDHMFFVYILVISCFGFQGWICVLIASFPGLCIRFTFKQYIYLYFMSA